MAICQPHVANSNTKKKCCVNCPTGYYMDKQYKYGNAQCQACAANQGMYQDELGQTSCKLCGAGFVPRDVHLQAKSTVDGACERCTHGRYQYVLHDVAPVANPFCFCYVLLSSYFLLLSSFFFLFFFSRYIASVASTSLVPTPDNPYQCFDCPAGWQYQEGVNFPSENACSLCPTGKNQPDKNQPAATCKFCAAGSVYVSAVDNCNECSAGTYQELNDSPNPSCKICPAGKEFVAKDVPCRDCTVGKDQISSVLSGQFCQSCSSGAYFVSTTQICQNCVAGQFDDGISMSSCSLCRTGTYQPVSGKTSCDTCPPGTYQDNLGKYQCKNCLPGMFLPSSSDPTKHDQEGDCEPCGVGFYNDSPGREKCYDCATALVPGADNCGGMCGVGKYKDSSTETCEFL